MKKLLFAVLALSVSSFSQAGLKEMMKIYNNPSSAPNTEYCAVSDDNCKAFTALAKQFDSIPKSYRYHGFDIRKDALAGDNYGLNKGFYYNTDRTNEILEGGDVYFDFESKKKSLISAKGMAVLLYIEDKNGWAND